MESPRCEAKLRALILQFEADNPPEHLGATLTKRGIEWEPVRMDLPHRQLELDEADMLMALGGSMHVNDVEQFPFLEEATQAVRTYVRQGRPYLGICLGGQMLARALGANVHANPKPEIGVVPVSLSNAADNALLRGLDAVIETLHFHEDTFDVPAGGVLLASSEHCATQMVRYGDLAYGLQFHPEVSAQRFAGWVEAFYAETTGDENPKRRRRIVDEVRSKEAVIRRHADLLLSNFVELAMLARARD
jgi:GMP synthase (glutamine-hydrolysing)